MNQEPKLPAFEKQVYDQTVPALLAALRAHPELRSVLLVMDWNSGLNAACRPGVWMDKHGFVGAGPEQACEPIAESVGQTLKMLKTQLRVLDQVQQRVLATLAELSERAKEAHEQTSGTQIPAAEN